MELKFLSVNLKTINQVLTSQQINKVIELQNYLIKHEIETRTLLSDQPYQSPLSTDISGLLRNDNQVLYIGINPINDLPVVITVAEPHPDAAQVCGLLSVSVEPMFQREGIGTKLIELIKKDLKENGFKEIVLFVDFRSPEAVAFYTALGFELTFANASLGI